MKNIVSTFKFDVEVAGIKYPKNLTEITVTPDGTVDGLPAPKEGVLFLVNARVLGAKHSRIDLVGFDPAKTVRNPKTGYATGQGGFIDHLGNDVTV